MKLFNSSKKKMLGQGMTEYIIIVALIAIAAIGVFAAFGDVVKNQVAAMAKELSGETGATQTTAAGTASTNAASKAAKKNDLKSFTGNQ
jgi:Flp pilus assembly pilin Flp